MKLSVAIPTKNGSAYLNETLASIAAQSRPPDELIVSDDMSDDDTVERIRHFAKTVPFEVRVVRHVPDGITANYLNALAQTAGDVIVFADQDDVWHHDRLLIIERAFQVAPAAVIVSSDSEIVDAELRRTGKTLRGDGLKSAKLSSRANAGENVEYVIRGVPLLAHTLAIRSVCRKAILNKPDFPENWWFESWASMVALSIGKLVLLPEALVLYRQHGAQVAGAPSKSHAPRATERSYQDASDRFRYVAMLMRDSTTPCLLSDEEAAARLNVLDEYVSFIEKRLLVLSKARHLRLGFIAAQSTVRDYFRFSSGLKSIARDLLRAPTKSEA